MLIRGETVKYSKRRARKRREEEQVAVININKLRETFAASGKETDANSLTLAQKQLEKIREPKIQGLITRSRVRWYDEGEKCSKFFLSLEKGNGKRKSIQMLRDNGQILSKKKDIISRFTQHISKRYNANASDNNSSAEEYLKNNIKNKLSGEQKQKLEEPISMLELTAALKSMKKGKSPGSNGFTASFFKHFWDYLGIFLFRSLQQSITEGSFSQTLREAMITLIPKTGKPLDTLKGWRPISLLNVDFKIISTALTNRLKNVMNDLISSSQSAYIKGRCIAENSRLVFDIIQKVNDEKRAGFIVAADFEAAFESVSWSFLSSTLDCCNFGQNFKHLLQLAYLNQANFSRILMDGYLGEKIYMKQGIRQGDPASGYLFNLVVEPLANHIRQSKMMSGITVRNNIEVRLSQYADDLIIFLDDQPKSISGAISEIKEFSSISGLHLNVDKTKCLPIGVDSRPPQAPSCHKIQYVNELKILGITFNRNNEALFTTNLKNKLPSIEKDILQWKRRHITLLGKITVIKSLLISQLVHLFLALPTPSKRDIAQIETKLFRFLWSDKNDKIKRTKIVQSREVDGLEMIDVNSFIKSMKVTWLKRLYQSQHDWANILRKELPPVHELLTYGCKALAKVKNKLHNPFWKEVIEAWSEFCATNKLNKDQILTEMLWFSNASKFSTSIVKSWDSKGLRFVADLINNLTGKLYSKEDLEKAYGIRMTFLC